MLHRRDNLEMRRVKKHRPRECGRRVDTVRAAPHLQRPTARRRANVAAVAAYRKPGESWGQSLKAAAVPRRHRVRGWVRVQIRKWRGLTLPRPKANALRSHAAEAATRQNGESCIV